MKTFKQHPHLHIIIMYTESSSPKFILVRIKDRSEKKPEFIDVAVKWANKNYNIVTEEEEKDLIALYEQKLAIGEDPDEVQKMITDHIHYMHDIYHQAREILDYAHKEGLDISFDVDIDAC
ncbi:hypothetical protein B0H10DRAFT_2186225 [Mycena sp. CBHHK59/15]|nr:hypothetical protein B0H10DRAFT_2186225 [Mycena sp. CBHHK59/15]